MMAIGMGLALGACAESTLTVMSFNVRYGTAGDGANAWPHRKTILTDTIRKFAPDVLGTQECLDFQADFIAQTLPEYRWIGIGRERDGKGEMAAVFYKKDLLCPIETGNFWLSETPDVPGSRSWNTECTRMVTWARFRHLPSGASFCFFDTHFDHASEEARQQSAALLARRAAALAGVLPIVIAGDFNAAAEETESWRILAQAGFTDAWVAAERKNGPEITFGDFAAPRAGEKGRIDWVLFRGPLKGAECETVLYNDKGRYPSDHFPVVARLVLSP